MDARRRAQRLLLAEQYARDLHERSGVSLVTRFQVRELHGFQIDVRGGGNSGGGETRKPGTSFNVLDTHWNYRLMRTFTTEGIGRVRYGYGRGHGREERAEATRQMAEQYAAWLEEKYAA